MGGLTDGTKGADIPPADRISILWRRVKEHRIAQWTVGYVAVAYGIQHAVTLTSEAFKWPDAVIRISMLLLALGLPVAMTLAWYHGERTARRISSGEMAIVSLLLVLISFAFYTVVRPTTNIVAERAPIAQEASVTVARQAAASPKGAISVAVLPFLNLSSDKEQEFFSDGMTEEITAALAKVPDMRVVARTSAFEFKGRNVDIEKIGQQLHATHLIEGSVRKAGNRVRITAQLIKADDGTHIWAEDYDRDLTDIFAVQEDIARAITSSLHMTLGLKPGENLVNQRTRDASAHEEYLRGKMLVRANLPEAIALLSDVVTREPGYAPAWGVLARAYAISLIANSAVLRGAVDEAKPVARELGQKEAMAAERAYKLDPTNADAVYGYSEAAWTTKEDFTSRMALLERSLALDPDNPEPLLSYALSLASGGFTKQAVKTIEHLLAVEPFVPTYRADKARMLIADGQLDAAIAAVKGDTGAGANLWRAEAFAAQGRFREAADTLALVKGPDEKTTAMVSAGARLLRAAPEPVAANDRPELGTLDWIYVYRGAPERLAIAYENRAREHLPISLVHGLEFAPAYASMRKTAVFKQYIRDTRTLAYWRAKGWPPQCHPTTADDFECS